MNFDMLGGVYGMISLVKSDRYYDWIMAQYTVLYFHIYETINKNLGRYTYCWDCGECLSLWNSSAF